MKKVLVIGLLALAGCASKQPDGDLVGRVSFIDAQGAAAGTAQLYAVTEGIFVSAELPGLPEGEHGLHFHAVGTCTPPGFESAGGHFNPTGKQHGLENPNGPHMGDMPNIERGRTSVGVTVRGLQITGPNGLLDSDGAALVVHAGRDDQKTDPSGNSGARIRCGVVEPVS